MTTFAYYSSIGCEPLASGRISNINEIIPTAVVDLFGHMPGFPGLLIASLSSAALSSMFSCLTVKAADKERAKEGLMENNAEKDFKDVFERDDPF